DLAERYNMPSVKEGVFTSLAVFYMERMEYDNAISNFEKAISIGSSGPNYGFQYAKLGECYFRLGEYKKAEALLKRAIAEANEYNVHTELSYYYVTLARIYEATDNYPEAAEYYSLYVAAKDAMDQNNIENAIF